MAQRILTDLFWVAVLAVVTVLLLRQSLAKLVRSAPQVYMRLQAIAALCEQRGMLPNAANLTTYLPMANPAQGPTFGNAFASPDGGLWAADLWRRNDKVTEAFSILVFTVRGVNMPYLAVARKGQTSMPAGAQGNPLELESIDFNNRFAIRAQDARSALMLLDLGMMQWLLGCDRVSFEMAGDRVQALVRRIDDSPTQVDPVELELLFKFCDGFLARVPQILRTDYATSTQQGHPSA